MDQTLLSTQRIITHYHVGKTTDIRSISIVNGANLLFEGLNHGEKLTINQIKGDTTHRYGSLIISEHQSIHILASNKDLG